MACINYISLTGTLLDAPELATKNAVDVVVSAPVSGQEYGNVNVYVRTTDASGDYYINYFFEYDVDAVKEDGGWPGTVNGHSNNKLYRVQEATLVEKTGDYSYNSKFDVLRAGEISYATKEIYNGTEAGDFVGGWHGDENIEDGKIYMYLDGVKLDLTKAGSYTGTHFEFDQTTIINRCETPDEDIMRHTQYMLLDTNGLRIDQSVEFLQSVCLDPDLNYLQMATVMRENTSLSATDKELFENFLIDTVVFLDANGGVKYTYDKEADFVGSSDKIIGADAANRYVEYTGDDGFYAFVGFVVADGSVKPSNVKIQVRQNQGDNKWYASFETYNSDNGTVPKGEVWNITDYYYIDYVKPNA